jgi:tetratricopeptide (TPR) repeat protein
VKALKQALELDDKLAEAHYLLGLCLRETRQASAAIASFDRAARLAPALVAAREQLAELYRIFDRPADEIEQLAALGGIESNRPERQIALAVAYARAGKTDVAINTLGAVSQRFPQQPRILAAVGRLWLDAAEAGEEGALAKALQALTRIATSPNADSETLALFGRALIASGDPVGAEDVLRQATERFPVDARAFTLLASAASRNKHPAVAREALLKYATLSGSRTEARVWVQLGDLSVQSNPDEAIGWYRRALSVTGADTPIDARLADAQIRAGDMTGARSTIERALERDPTDAAVLAVARKLKP